MKIPLHSLVVCTEPTIFRAFPNHEIVSLDSISAALVGSRHHDISPIAYTELRHRIALKLSLGERVVLDPTGLTHDQQYRLSLLAKTQGAYQYAIGRDPSRYFSGHILPTEELEPVIALPAAPLAHLRSRWQGITVIGDVHGELGALEKALDWARTRGHFVCFLGDVIDYGAQSLQTMFRAYQAVMHGEAAMILGNHERKIARWLYRDSHEHVRLSDGNRVTCDALDALPADERTRWVGQFRALLAHTSLSLQFDHITFLHAAAHPSVWQTPERYAVEQFALYGESDQTSGHYQRTHRWIDAVPQGRTVIVGHDRIFNYPMIVTGMQGGQVVFLDTGCGKGGQLSSADLRFNDENKLFLECFNRHRCETNE